MDSTFTINLIHITLLLFANFLWNFFILFVILKFIFKIQKALWAGDFYFYIIYVSIGCIIINQGFEYIIEIEQIKVFWEQTTRLHQIGFLIIPVGFLIYLNYCLCKKIFKFDKNDALIVAIIMGFLGGPWPLLL
jgi:hypothetical protein